jgi:hypothetical protein
MFIFQVIHIVIVNCTHGKFHSNQMTCSVAANTSCGYKKKKGKKLQKKEKHLPGPVTRASASLLRPCLPLVYFHPLGVWGWEGIW